MKRLVVIVSLACSAMAQAPARAVFDVTSVRPTAPDHLYHLKFDECPSGGTFIANGTPLEWVVDFAFAGQNVRVRGGPPWLRQFDAAYDVEGKPDRVVTREECRAMVQSLLEDRFKLKIHREIGEVPAFALVVAKNGPKLHPAKPLQDGGGVRINGAVQQAISEDKVPDGWSMARLAGFVSDFVHRPVVDRTGLSGAYSFSMQFAHTDDADDPAIATALDQQLGLKLEPTKTNLNVVVIDHIERPDPN